MAKLLESITKTEVDNIFRKFKRSEDINKKKKYINKLKVIDNYYKYLTPDDILEIIMFS